MGISSKIVGSVFALGLAANYSNLCLEAFGTVRNSVITVELTRIDQQLRQHEIMTWGETAGASEGGFPGDGTDPEADQQAFEEFMAEVFDTPGRNPTKDTFGNTWLYTRFSDGYRLTSIGGDHEEGTDDDQWLERHGSKTEMNRSLEDVATAMEGKAKELQEEQKKVLDEMKKVAEATAEDLEEAESENKEPEETPPEGEGEPTEETPSPGMSSARAKPGSRGAGADASLAAASAKRRRKRPAGVATASSAGSTQPASSPPQPALTRKQKRKALFNLQAGKSMLMNNRVDKARTYFQKVINDFPKTSHAAEAQRRLAKLDGK